MGKKKEGLREGTENWQKIFCWTCRCWGDISTLSGPRNFVRQLPFGIEIGESAPIDAKVAEWQTRWTQNPVSERTCGFDSHLWYFEHLWYSEQTVLGGGFAR